MRYREILSEGNVSDEFIERLGDTILRTFAERIPAYLNQSLKRFGKDYAKQYGRDALLNPEFLGRMTIGEVADQMPDQTPAVRTFFAGAAAMTVSFKFDMPGYAAAYHRREKASEPNFVLIRMPEAAMETMVNTIERRRKLRPEAVLAAISIRRSEFIHELRHIYDDMLSQGKFMQNRRSQAAIAARRTSDRKTATALYFDDPIEISARLTGSLAHNAAHLSEPFADYLKQVRADFGHWEDVSPREQRRLTKRIASYYQHRRPVRESQEVAPTVMYHATFNRKVPSIMAHGLGAEEVRRNFEISRPGVVTMSDDPDVAEAYVREAQFPVDDDIALLAINVTHLDRSLLHLDQNDEGEFGGTNYEYHGIIPPAALSVI